MIPIPEPSDFHRESHRDLLVTPDVLAGRPARRRPPVDAIVVPAGRPAAHLHDAMTLAACMGSTLVVLCSRDARADDVRAMADAHEDLECVAVDISARQRDPLRRFRTTRHPQVADRASDLSAKRTLGLLLARHAGWDRVLFLDDDVRGLTAERVAGMAAHLGRPVPGGERVTTAVGLRVTQFPDNSVVCHAHRDAGGRQDVFVSGSVLAVEVTAATPFFPQIYNEDWLFLLDDVRRVTVAVAGEVSQLAYDPYADPARAVSEEFGDVVAEGLMTELHRDDTVPRAAFSAGFWEPVLARRKAFLADVLARTDDPRARASVEAAEGRRARITPEDCASWVRSWQDDLTAWESRFGRIEGGLTVDQALRRLGLLPDDRRRPRTRRLHALAAVVRLMRSS